MTPNPILKVLSTLKEHNVRSLLIGGQACIIYGAAEFSRDSDFVILSTQENLECLKRALDALEAMQIYVPPLETEYLDRGHACHFRCAREDVKNLRVDVISKLRGCGDFNELWGRKSTVSLKDKIDIDVIGLKDLVRCKKTQRDKDWFMLRRLVNNDIILNKEDPSNDRVKWWLYECREPDTLIEIAREYPEIVKNCIADRKLLSFACSEEAQLLEEQLRQEEMVERKKDKEYWAPLIKELEVLRRDMK